MFTEWQRAEEMARLKERAMYALDEGGGEELEEEHHAALQPFGYKQGGHWTAEVRPSPCLEFTRLALEFTRLSLEIT